MRSRKDLAAQFGVNVSTVDAITRAAGLKRLVRRLEGEQAAEACRLYAQGWTIMRIAVHVEFSGKTVWTVLQRSGVQMRDFQGRDR